MSDRRGAAVMTAVVALGAVLGLVGARYVFVSSALSLIPWGVAAAAIGYLAPTRRMALIAAALFGFALTTSFMFFGYEGNDSLASRTVPFCIIGLVGAACALIPAAVGVILRRRR